MIMMLNDDWNMISSPPKKDGVYRLFSCHYNKEINCRYSVKNVHWGECLSTGPALGFYTHWAELDEAEI